jgi:hypothetical protein
MSKRLVTLGHSGLALLMVSCQEGEQTCGSMQPFIYASPDLVVCTDVQFCCDEEDVCEFQDLDGERYPPEDAGWVCLFCSFGSYEYYGDVRENLCGGGDR